MKNCPKLRISKKKSLTKRRNPVKAASPLELCSQWTVAGHFAYPQRLVQKLSKDTICLEVKESQRKSKRQILGLSILLGGLQRLAAWISVFLFISDTSSDLVTSLWVQCSAPGEESQAPFFSMYPGEASHTSVATFRGEVSPEKIRKRNNEWNSIWADANTSYDLWSRIQILQARKTKSV